MRRFIRRVLTFGVAVLVFASAWLALNVYCADRITFRTWESLIWYRQPAGVYGSFYPRQTSNRMEFGDLAYRTEHSIPKTCAWTTDALGFRNLAVPEAVDIVVVGDSFVGGTPLSQNETLSVTLGRLSGLGVYQMTADPNTVLFLIRTRAVPKPRIVVCTLAERSVPRVTFEPYDERMFLPLRVDVGVADLLKDKCRKNAVLRKLQAELAPGRAVGIPSVVDPKWYFLEGEKAAVRPDPELIESVLDAMARYAEAFRKEGIDYVYALAPNKETLYYEFVPFPEQPSFLKELASRARKRKLHYVDLLEAFNASKPSKLLYHTDDSHWNGNATEAAAAEILKYLESNSLLRGGKR